MSDEYVGKVYVISPIEEETGGPIELYFVVTEGGLLIHMEKMDKDISDSVVQEELAKLLFGLESSSGRYNEFVKNRDKYTIRMAVVPPITLADAREIDKLYKMSKEKRLEAIKKNIEKVVGDGSAFD